MRRVGPEGKTTLRDKVLPERHANWWNFNEAEKKDQTVEELYEGLFTEGREQVAVTLEHVAAIASTAVDRAAAADRRATTIAGTVAIAASFSLSGGGLILDRTKIVDGSLRLWFAIVLAFTTTFFVLSAAYALRALVRTRITNWEDPHDLPRLGGESLDKQLGMRAAHLLFGFGGNWEISDLKNRNVDNALRCLFVALVGIAVFAASLIVDVA